MRINDPKDDNLDKLLDGISLLDDQDRDRVIRMVDTLDCVDKNVKSVIFSNIQPLKQDTSPVCIGVKI